MSKNTMSKLQGAYGKDLAEKAVQCRAIDMHGRRCRNIAVMVANYHGDHELYDGFDDKPGWVKVELCKKHQI